MSEEVEGSDDVLSIARSVMQGIQDEDFQNPDVDALLGMVWQDGHVDVFGDVLAYLTSNQHPDWAAELCRMVMAGPDGASVGPQAVDRDFVTVAKAVCHIVDAHPLDCAVKVCQYILDLRKSPNGENYFDNYDVSMVFGCMVEERAAAAVGQVLYAIWCDESNAGQVYQTMVPYVLGTLLDQHKPVLAVEICKQLMYEDGECSIDYSCMGWSMVQMVYCGRADWAAALCDSLKFQRLQWYKQGAMLHAIANWGGQTAAQTVANFMQGAVPSTNGAGHGHHHVSPTRTSPGQGQGRGQSPSTPKSPTSPGAPPTPEVAAESLAQGVSAMSMGTPPRALEVAAAPFVPAGPQSSPTSAPAPPSA